MNLNQELNHNTLFSALVSKPTSNLNKTIEQIHLDIPDLPNDANLFSWQIPQTSNYEWIDYHNLMTTRKESVTTVDEGFCSVKCSPVSQKKEDDNGDVWTHALNLSISDYSDWDMRDQ